MISARRGPIPGDRFPSTNAIRETFPASLRTTAAGANPPELALREFLLADFEDLPDFARAAAHASDNAAAVPEVAITS